MEPPLNPDHSDLQKPKDPLIKSGISKIYGDRSYPFLLIGVIIAGFGLLLGTFIRLISSVSNQSEPTSSPANPIVTAIAPSSEVITLVKFNQIQNGMTIKQVQELIGSSGKLLGTSTTNNIEGKVYWWQNAQGSNAIIEFKNDQVVTKSQAGLK